VAAPVAAAWSAKKQSPGFAKDAPYTVAPCELRITPPLRAGRMLFDNRL